MARTFAEEMDEFIQGIQDGHVRAEMTKAFTAYLTGSKVASPIGWMPKSTAVDIVAAGPALPSTTLAVRRRPLDFSDLPDPLPPRVQPVAPPTPQIPAGMWWNAGNSAFLRFATDERGNEVIENHFEGDALYDQHFPNRHLFPTTMPAREPVEPIPEGVHWNDNERNFFYDDHRGSCGSTFFFRWFARHQEFPQHVGELDRLPDRDTRRDVRPELTSDPLEDADTFLVDNNTGRTASRTPAIAVSGIYYDPRGFVYSVDTQGAERITHVTNDATRERDLRYIHRRALRVGPSEEATQSQARTLQPSSSAMRLLGEILMPQVLTAIDLARGTLSMTITSAEIQRVRELCVPEVHTDELPPPAPEGPWSTFREGTQGNDRRFWRRDQSGQWWFRGLNTLQWTPMSLHGNEWLPSGPERDDHSIRWENAPSHPYTPEHDQRGWTPR